MLFSNLEIFAAAGDTEASVYISSLTSSGVGSGISLTGKTDADIRGLKSGAILEDRVCHDFLDACGIGRALRDYSEIRWYVKDGQFTGVKLTTTEGQALFFPKSADVYW